MRVDQFETLFYRHYPISIDPHSYKPATPWNDTLSMTQYEGNTAHWQRMTGSPRKQS